MSQTVIICTQDELDAMVGSGIISEDDTIASLSLLFDVLLEHYGYQPGFPTNDIH